MGANLVVVETKMQFSAGSDVSFIRFIIRAAILESQFTTPYSGNKRESTLSTFEGTGGPPDFDFITLPGGFIFEEPDDETIVLF
ncbi:hypothetical protein GX51_06595 [Blastomyces parvus]|uniref:Uncharacterized protein n=1 Tax=Blastomyces parvus TaxID=2060905 RepID=A0A2B7WQF3_9EURO|nr:hypothetical protein GX51_06595 [Blastomyces parvus]